MGKKNIFLTGGSGFIGRNIAEHLSAKYNIFTPGHSELGLENSEAVEHYIKSHNFDVVIHAADWGVIRKKDGNKTDIAEINLRFFSNIIKCKKYFGRIIQLGSGAEYNKLYDIRKIKEEDLGKYIPTDPYGFYKYFCSKYLEMLDDTVALRIFGCYGKYEHYRYRFISNAICRAVFDLPITILNKNAFFDYLYVDDLVRIIDHFIETKKPKYKSYNVTPGESIDLLTLAEKVRDTSGKNLEIIVKNKGLGPEYTGDNARLKEEMKGFGFTNIDDGIRKLYKWYEENKSTIDYNAIAAIS